LLPVLQQTRFQDMSDGLVERIDELGARIDELEHSITRCEALAMG